MPESTNNLIGGMLTGFTGAKNAARDRNSMEEYRKAMTDHVKTQAKLEEQKINLMAMKMQGLSPEDRAALNKASETENQPQSPIPIGQGVFGQMVPGPGPQAGIGPRAAAPIQQQPLENTIAAGQMGGNRLVQMPPEGQLSTRNNNVYNIKPSTSGWEAQFGGIPGEGGFVKYPTPEAGVAAATHLIQRDYAGLSIKDGIERFAPTWQNPGTPKRIAETARAFGVTPDTPIGNLPLGPFMAMQAKYESPSQINPAIWGQAGSMPIGQTIGTNPVMQTVQTQQGQGPSQGQIQAPSFPKKTGMDALGIGDRLALDIFFKNRYDLNTGFAKEGGRRYKLQGNPYDGYTSFDENTGKIAWATPPLMMKTEPYNYTDNRGTEMWGRRPGTVPQPFSGGGLPASPQGIFSGGQPGEVGTGSQGNVIKPGPQDLLKEVPDNIRGELQKGRDNLAQLSTMRDLVQKADDSLFGFWAATKHNLYQNEDSALKATARAGFEFLGDAPSKKAADFRVKLEQFNSKMRYELYAGNLTETEALKYQKQALAASTKPQYLSVLNGMEATIRRRMQDRILESAGTQGQNLERSAGQTLGDSPLPGSKPNYKFNPATGKLEASP